VTPTSTQFRIELPNHLRFIARMGEDVVCLRPDLDCRTDAMALAISFSVAASGGEAAVFVPDGLSLRVMLDDWLAASGLGVQRRWTCDAGDAKAHMVTLKSGGRLWLVCGARPQVDRIPMRPHVVTGDVCDRIATDLASEYRGRSRLLLSGTLADRGHWFYELARNGECAVETVSLDDVLAAYPGLALDAERYDPTLAPRRLRLEDVVPRPAPQKPFGRFAINRLRIKSDKPPSVLHPKQREIALSQPGVTPIVPFYVSALQRRYMAMKRLAVMKGRKPWYLLLKYRRGGFTTLEQGLSYRMCVTSARSEVATLAHHKDPTQRIFRIARLMAEQDPAGTKLIGDSKSALEFANGSSFFIGTAGGSGFARGDTLRRVHGSEIAKWCRGPRQETQVEDLLAGILGAASYGEVVLETTAAGREHFCRMYQEAKRGENEFTPLFLRWFDDPMNRALPGTYSEEELLDTLSAREKDLMERFGLDLAQIAFRREKVRVYKRLFPQEMPEDDETCFITSGVCWFDTDMLLTIAESLPEEEGTWSHLPGGYEVRWKEPEVGREYVAGCDTSEGLPGCDNSGLGVLDKRTGEQVAAIHGLFAPRVLAGHAVRVCRDYNDALLGVERENHGHAVIMRVMDLGYRKPHFRGGPLYYFDRRKDVKKARAGWTTNAQTRPVMLEDLAEDIEEGGQIVHDKQFIEEALSFRLQPSGKFEADPGAKDDAVMKWAIAGQMRRMRRRKPRITVG